MTPRAQKLREDGMKLREKAEKKQDVLSSARKLSLQTSRALEQTRKAEGVELAKQRYESRKELASQNKAIAKNEKKRKATADTHRHIEETRQKRTNASARKRELEDRLSLQAEHREDVKRLKKTEKSKKRQSLAFRREERARHKFNDAAKLVAMAEYEAEEQDIKQADAMDIENFRLKMKEDKRKSLAFRREEHMLHNMLGSDAVEATNRLEEEEAEVKLKEREDVELHKNKLSQGRRQSVQTRRQYAQLQTELEECRKYAEEQQHEAEVQLEQQDREDMLANKQKQAESKRQSMLFRREEFHRVKEMDEMDELKQKDREQQERVLRLEDAASQGAGRQTRSD
jgi:hypothetical protein